MGPSHGPQRGGLVPGGARAQRPGPRDEPLAQRLVQLLVDEPFALLTRGLRVRSRVDAWFAAMRLAPRIALESNAVATVLAMVRAGLAVTVLPEPRLAEAPSGWR